MPVTEWLSDLHKTEDNVTRVRMFIARSTLENCFLPTDSVRGRWSVSGCLSGLISVSWALFPVSQLPRIWGLDCRPTSDWWTPAAGTSRVTPGQARPGQARDQSSFYSSKKSLFCVAASGAAVAPSRGSRGRSKLVKLRKPSQSSRFSSGQSEYK